MNVHEKVTLDREIYDYQLTELLAQNSFGARYQGIEISTKRPVYVLVFNSLVGNDPVLSEQIVQLAEKMKVLKHPSILQVLTCIRGAQGCIWVEEYVQGKTLDRYIDQKGPLEWQQTLRYLRQMLAGLDMAHTHHILHEALHPGNILISRGNTAKIMQFGLASIVRNHSYLILANQDADPYNMYLAPEIAGRQELASRAADLYSTGLVAYEMLTKEQPINSLLPSELPASFPDIAPPHTLRSSIPTLLSDVIMHALEEHSVHRFQRASQMLEALSTLQTNVARPNVVYHKESYTQNLVKSLSSRKFLITLAILAAVLFALLIYKMNVKNPFEALDAQIPVTLSAPMPDSPELQESPPASVAVVESSLEAAIGPQTAQAETPAEAISSTQVLNGTLEVTSTPSGATVSLDERMAGKTPLELNLSPGPRTVTLTLDGHQAFVENIHIESERTTQTSVIMEPEYAVVTVHVSPWGSVYLDGILLAERVEGRESFNISTAPHTLSILNPTYGRWERRLHLLPDEQTVFPVDFTKHVTVSITAFDEEDRFIQGEIFLDGQSTSYFTPMTIDIPVGLHTVEVRAQGYSPESHTATWNSSDPSDAPLKFTLKSIE